jgi:hydrogenase maturation protease
MRIIRLRRTDGRFPTASFGETVENKKPVLILGVGNLLLRDEGVGIHVVNRLAEMDLPAHVEVLDGGTSGFDLVDQLEGRKKVIFIDTVRGGQAPGTLYRMTTEDIEEQAKSRLSLHDIDVNDLLKLIDVFGIERPEIVVYGVEPKDMESADLELTPEVAAQVPKLIAYVLKEIGVS